VRSHCCARFATTAPSGLQIARFSLFLRQELQVFGYNGRLDEPESFDVIGSEYPKRLRPWTSWCLALLLLLAQSIGIAHDSAHPSGTDTTICDTCVLAHSLGAACLPASASLPAFLEPAAAVPLQPTSLLRSDRHHDYDSRAPPAHDDR